MRSWLRADLLIALCALLISSLSCVATIFQTHVIANQLSASVWPYLSYEVTFGQNGATMVINNDGLGPALIRFASLEIDGRRVDGWTDGLRKSSTTHLAFKKMHGIKAVGSSFTSLDPSSVIRSGESHRLFALTVAAATPADAQAALEKIRSWLQKRVAVNICYCSTLGQCWLTSTGSSQEPQSVARCPAPSGINA